MPLDEVEFLYISSSMGKRESTFGGIYRGGDGGLDLVRAAVETAGLYSSIFSLFSLIFFFVFIIFHRARVNGSFFVGFMLEFMFFFSSPRF